MGPHLHPQYFTKKRKFDKDAYESPKYVLDMVLDQLDPEKWEIWEPFPGSGYSTLHMRNRGFTVTNGKFDDFFQHKEPPTVTAKSKNLAVVTNPPYSKNKQILKHLKDLRIRSMALLIPVGVTFTRFYQHLFPLDQQQLIWHVRQCKFLDPYTHEKVGRASFDVLWATSGLRFDKDIQFLAE